MEALTLEEIKQGCSAYIDRGGSIGTYCELKPTLRYGGKLYCTVHNPVRLRARMDARIAREDENRKQAEQVKEDARDRLWQEGRQAGIREVVEWLEKYAIHGGRQPLFNVLDDLKIHSPYGKVWEVDK